MRRFAICLALLAFSSTEAANADSGHPPQAYPVKLVASPAAPPPFVFDTQSSIAENNQRAAERQDHAYLLVEVTVPRQGLTLKGMVGRRGVVSVGKRTFVGEVFAFSFTSQVEASDQITLNVRIRNHKLPDGVWALHPGVTGTLELMSRSLPLQNHQPRSAWQAFTNTTRL